MKSFPESVAGTDRMCTDLMRAVDGRIVAKTGAEGVYCAAIPGAELGIALKVEDGARRAAEPALVAVLRSLGLLSDREMGTLSGYAEPEIRNTRGELAGRIRAVIELETGVAGVEGGG
jgi:L-asparaginase II